MAMDMFLTFDKASKIKGETVDEKYKKEDGIDVLCPLHSRRNPVGELAGDVAVIDVREFDALRLEVAQDARNRTTNGSKTKNGDFQIRSGCRHFLLQGNRGQGDGVRI